MRKVLLVDDEIYIRKGLRAIIERSELSFKIIEECDNGKSALEMMTVVKFDLAVVDIRMPHMDGITLLKEARKLEHKPMFIILSGYDDFNYAKEAIRNDAKDYLLKPVDRMELIESLEKIEKELQKQEMTTNEISNIDNAFHQFCANELNYILLNAKVTTEEIQKIFATIKPDLCNHAFRITLINTSKNNFREDKGHYIPIRQSLDGYFRESAYKNMNFLDNDGNIVVVTDKAILFDDFMRYLDKENAGEYFISVSAPGCGPDDFRTAYLQAQEALKYRIIKSGKNLVFYEEIRGKSDDTAVNIDLIKKIAEMVGANRIDEINKSINQLFDKRLLEEVNMSYVEKTAGSLIKYVIEPSLKYLPHRDTELNADCEHVKSVYNYDSLQDYIFSLKNLILQMNDFLMEVKKEYREKNAIDIAIKWLDENSHRGDMTMTLVANQVSLNYSYFSLAFKERTGMSFITYLKKIRIERAKELLRNSDSKINEIAQKVGFQNPRLFAKSFREEIGISPIEYSKKLP